MAFGGGGSSKLKSDINVTPLVDIVLVMLIIFLVAMPMVLKMIDLEVPKKLDAPEDYVPSTQVTLEVTKAGVIMLDGIETPRTELANKLRAKLENKREKAVFVDFDENTEYGVAVSLMDLARGAGATTVALKIKDEANTGGAPGDSIPTQPAPNP